MIRDRIKELRRVKASELKPSPRNWRTHPDSQRTAIEAVLAEVGYADALLARELPDGSLELVDGHLRADLDPEQTVPVLVLDVDEAEAGVILATLDPLAGLAEADEQKLGELLAGIETESEGLQALLEELAADAGLDLFEPAVVEEPEAQVDRAAELQKEWGTKLGQLWVIGEHRLLCGDSTKAEDVGRVMGEGNVGALVTDPPYGIGVDRSMHKKGGQQYGKAAAPKRQYAETDWDHAPSSETIDAMIALCRDVIIWGGNYFALPPARCWLVWDKDNGNNQFADCELAWTSLDKPVRLKKHTWNGMIRKGREERNEHPTQKPVGIMAWCVDLTSGTILDPFLGSGTTMVAAQQLNRRCYGIEISPAYVAVCLQRMADMGLTPRLES